MRSLVIAALLLAAVGAADAQSRQPPQQRDAANSASERGDEERGSSANPFVVEVHPRARSEAQAKEEQAERGLDTIVDIAQIVAAIGAAAAAAFAAWAAGAASTSANVAKKALEGLERPVFFVECTGLHGHGQSFSREPEFDETFNVQYRISSHGRLPGTVRDFRMGGILAPDALSAVRDAKLVEQDSPSWFVTGEKPKNESRTVSIHYVQADVALDNANSKKRYIVATMTYFDGLGRAYDHGVCWLVKGATAVEAGGGECNYDRPRTR